jgi:hypothetical protein
VLVIPRDKFIFIFHYTLPRSVSLVLLLLLCLIFSLTTSSLRSVLLLYLVHYISSEILVLIPFHPIECCPPFPLISRPPLYNPFPVHTKIPIASPIDLMQEDFCNEFCRVISEVHQWEISWWRNIFFLKIQVFEYLLPCVLLNSYWRFEGYECVHCQGQAGLEFFAQKVMVLQPLETSNYEEPISICRTQHIFDIIIIINMWSVLRQVHSLLIL